MQLLISTVDLTLQFDSSDFILKAQRQIAKDFHQCGLEFPDYFIIAPLSKDQIKSNIETALTEVIQADNLSQLLYQVDIPETVYVSLLNEPDFNQQMSEIILRREAYKVYLRTLY